MTEHRASGGAAGSPGRRLRRAAPAATPPEHVPAPLRRRSAAENQLVAGLFAIAFALGLGGTVLVLDAPPSERDTVTAAFRAAPLAATAAALAGAPLPDAPPAAPPAMAGPQEASAATTDEGAASATVAERGSGFSPRALTIPAIGLTTGVLTTGMTEDRNLEVPADPQRVGWYRGFAEPGDPGVSVLLGHVDSRDGPGVFFQLPELEPGDRIEVERHDGAEVTYEVTDVSWYDKDDFPTLDVYTSERDQVLRLITCGGDFDTSRRTYLENVVVSAVPVEVAPPPPTDGSIPA